MKGRYALAALALAALIAVGVPLAQRSLDDTTAKPQPTAKSKDPSRSHSSEFNEQGKAQAEQMRIALEELEARTAAREHELEVTIRDEAPLGIWKVNGQTCVLAYGPSSTTINVSQPTDDASTFEVRQEFVPSKARLLKSGACQTTMNIFVRDAPSYDLSLGGGNSKTFHVVHEGRTQRVTLVH